MVFILELNLDPFAKGDNSSGNSLWMLCVDIAGAEVAAGAEAGTASTVSLEPQINPPPAMIYPPARARTLHSAIGRHGGAAGPGTTSPALIRSNRVYRIVIEDREDDIVIIEDERRGGSQEARSLPSMSPSLARSLSSIYRAYSALLPSLLSPICCLHFAATQDGWMDGGPQR